MLAGCGAGETLRPMVAEVRVAGRPTDAELVVRCVGGESAAWETLVDRYARYVHAILKRAYRLPPDAVDDVFQDVFIRIYERLHTLRGGDAQRPWIAQLTRRAAIDALRRSEREAVWEELVEGEIEIEFDWVEQLETRLSVRAAIAELPPDGQEIVERFYLRDQSYRAIGSELGLRDGTVASRLSRALTRLQGLLGRNEPPQPSSSTSPSF